MSQTRAHRATTRRATTAAAAIVVALGIGMPAASAGDGEVRTSGACSRTADWKLKAKPDNGRIEMEFEVDANRVGQTWNVEIRDNGILVHSGTHRTVAPSGSFSITKRIANRADSDVLTARAARPATVEVCSGRLTFPG